MQLTEIENLSATELKEQFDTLVSEAALAPPEELARRYVAARLDAKVRDEKLSEQGLTITSLNDALATAKSLTAKMTTDIASLKASIADRDSVVAENARLKEQSEANKTLAKNRRAALADIMKTISPLLAAE